MINNVLAGMTEVHIYSVIAQVIFITVLLGALIRVATMRKAEAIALSRMPLEDSNVPVQGDLRHDR